jgi:hypothetical protein
LDLSLIPTLTLTLTMILTMIQRFLILIVILIVILTLTPNIARSVVVRSSDLTVDLQSQNQLSIK